MSNLNEAVLSEYDFVVVVDASGSMGTEDVRGKSRWNSMQESVGQIVRDIAQLDSDGIDLVIFNGQSITEHTGVTPSTLDSVFASRSPRSTTPLTEALNAALKLAGKSAKKDFILVITDGVPDDQQSVKEVLVNAANSQETDDALTVLFLQIGYDAEATKYLTNLDDNLVGAKFDIVDVKTMEQADQYSSTTQLIIDAIND